MCVDISISSWLVIFWGRKELNHISQKSVGLRQKIGFYRKSHKIKEKRRFEKRDRPTFYQKRLQKQRNWVIIEFKNSVNTVVVPYLWGIDTLVNFSSSDIIALTSCTLPMRNWHKLNSFIAICLSFICCTLPMRNWHILHNLCAFVNFLVVPYLWGIDTFTSISKFYYHIQFVVPYLWGIDTYYFLFFDYYW